MTYDRDRIEALLDGGVRDRVYPGAVRAVGDATGALVLGYLAENLSGQPLDQLATARTWHPLGMASTRFGPLPADLAAGCAPTEPDQDTDTHLKGVAHDFPARLLGGVCGIAGVFTVVDDLAAFLRYMLTPATSSWRAGFGSKWATCSLTKQTGDLQPARACSGIRLPAPLPRRRSGSTTASPAQACGSPHRRPVGGAFDQQALLLPRPRTAERCPQRLRKPAFTQGPIPSGVGRFARMGSETR